MEQHVIDIREDYGQFIELDSQFIERDIESLEVIQKEPKKVVTLICDTGNKYLSKAYNKDWVEENL